MIPPTGPFPREARIRRSREFREMSEGSRRQASGAFVLLARPQSTVGGGRLGVTASRKVGNSVVRNRVKRRIREWFRREGRELTAGLDLVVIARSGVVKLSAEESFAELTRITKAVR